MASAKFTVRGMTCDHCRHTVEKALRGVAGTFGAAVLLAEAEAEVDYDAAKASIDDYVQAVAARGYSATPVE